jgi:hypothetical protein
MQGRHGSRPAGDVPIDERKDGRAIAEELRGAKGGEGLSQQGLLPQLILQPGQGLAPDAAVGGGREGLDQEFEVAREDVEGLVEFGGDAELPGVLYGACVSR